jgi:uncharacterized protein (DUF1499 family)
MLLRLLAVALALGAGVLLLSSGLGVRAGLWPFGTGFLLLGLAACVGLAAAALAIVALALPKQRSRGARSLIAALVIGLAAAFVPWQLQQNARSVPLIHDITTDTENPPAFVAALPRRASASNDAAYAGRQVAEQQRKAYPDIQPVTLGVPPSLAMIRARDAAESMGWEVIAADAASGRLEAVATTTWFGFKDDVVVRISPAGSGSRIDVRSKSRVGRGDAGTNARRIRDYLDKLRR